MRELGAEVVPVKSGSRTLKDAVNEANRNGLLINKCFEVAGQEICKVLVI